MRGKEGRGRVEGREEEGVSLGQRDRKEYIV